MSISNYLNLYKKLFLISLLTISCVRACPPTCECKWKNGKQTVECTKERNSFTDIPSGLDQGTQVLDLSNNELKIIQKNAFQKHGLVNLQKIHLSKCKINEIHNDAFLQLTNLVYLDLSYNELTQIPYSVFRNTPSLRQLILRGNLIKHIPTNAFTNTPSLVHLDLSHCNIVSVARKAFGALSLLETLQMQSNKLRELPSDILNSLRSSHDLQLQNNDWICDCRALPLWKLLKEQKITQTPKCHSPSRVKNRNFKNMTENEFACPPEVVSESKVINAYAGENTTIHCRTKGQPPPHVRWYMNNKLITNGSVLGLGPQRAYLMRDKSDKLNNLLVITTAQEENSGSLSCVAENPAGSATGNYTLIVNMRALSSSSIHPGHIAGISIALIIFAIFVLVVAFLVFAKSRTSSSPTPAKLNISHVSSPSEPNPVQKPPRLTDLSNSASTDPDIISEVDKNGRGQIGMNGHIPNGKLNHSNLTENGEYTRMEGDSLYPSGIWDGERPIAHEHFNPGYVHQNSPMHNSTQSSIQGPMHSTPYKQADDPQIYGYPSDYGLPMPEVYPESLYSSRQELQTSMQSGSNRQSLYSSGQDLYGSKQDMYNSKNELSLNNRDDIYQERNMYPLKQQIYESPQRKILSPGKHPQDVYSPFHQQKHSMLYSVEEGPDIRDADIAEGAESSPIHDPPGERPWVPGCQGSPAVPMGVQVLPPLPTGGLHRIKPRDSPDEGYQEGTDV